MKLTENQQQSNGKICVGKLPARQVFIYEGKAYTKLIRQNIDLATAALQLGSLRQTSLSWETQVIPITIHEITYTREI